MKDDLLAYKAEYFQKIAEKVLSEFLEENGFHYYSCDDFGGLIYVRGRIFIAIDYLPETSPRYALMFNMGIRDDDDAINEETRSIGLWRVIPKDVNVAPPFEFSDEEELKRVLLFWRDKLIPNYVSDLWADSDKLKELIKKRNEEREDEFKHDRLQEKKRKAEQAFRFKNFDIALRIYSEIDESLLTAVEKKRIEISKKYREGQRK